MTSVDGTYSIVFSGQAGSSLAVANIRNGQLEARDSGGAVYSGTVTRQADQSVVFNISISLPAGSFGVWGSSNAQMTETRHYTVAIPGPNFDGGAPYKVPSFDMYVTFRRVPEEGYAVFAGPDGFRHSAMQFAGYYDHWVKEGR